MIDYWSYSSFTNFLSDPASFKKKYILKIYDDQTTPSAVVGKAGHKALQSYYTGTSVEDSITEGINYINSVSPYSINFGKTGSVQGIISDYTKAINFYFAEEPQFHNIIDVEKEIVVEVNNAVGQPMPMPIKCYPDMIVKNKLGQVEVIDYKFITSYTDSSIQNPKHYIQAYFLQKSVEAKYNCKVSRVRFLEIKKSKNKDNTPQLQEYVIEIDDVMPEMIAIENLVVAATEQLNLEGFKFLPNVNDMFSGQNSFDIMIQGVMGVERPTEITHKTEQRAFTEKKYVASAHDRIENKEFTDEERIRLKLQEFAIPVEMRETIKSASVTRFTLSPSAGVSMSSISKLTNDIAIALGAERVRIEAPIRGTKLVGIEIPSKDRKIVNLTDDHIRPGTLSIPVGMDINGNIMYKNINSLPHLLVAGSTGSGKSVFLNTVIETLTRQNNPEDLELVLIDPKLVEFAPFSKLPHVTKFVTNYQEAIKTLEDIVTEMDARYTTLMNSGCRSISEYKGDMKYKVVVIDEFADLMMAAKPSTKIDWRKIATDIDYWYQDNMNLFEMPKMKVKVIKGFIKDQLDGSISVEDSIIRIAQKARAVGIHLIIATQRPSVDVITGLIKANIPAKIAFTTTNATNSRIILDQTGAEELTGKGDMLYIDTSISTPVRLQGLYI